MSSISPCTTSHGQGGGSTPANSRRPTGGAIEIICFTGRWRAPCSATQLPKEKPASHSASFGRTLRTQSVTASRSSVSPRPWSKLPCDWPTPRKLKRTAARPSSLSARAAMVTTLLCSVPPSGGLGWQTTATPARSWPGSGRSTISSSWPAGPGISRGPDSLGKSGSAFMPG